MSYTQSRLGEETVGDTKIVVTSTQDTNTTPYTTPFKTWALFAQWSHGEHVRSYFQTNNRSIFYFNSKQPSHTLGHKLRCEKVVFTSLWKVLNYHNFQYKAVVFCSAKSRPYLSEAILIATKVVPYYFIN